MKKYYKVHYKVFAYKADRNIYSIERDVIFLIFILISYLFLIIQDEGNMNYKKKIIITYLMYFE